MQTDSFSALGLAEPIVRALDARGYRAPTPIQAQAIPHLLAERDLLGIAQTGTGKTAAFALPLLQLLAERRTRPLPGAPRALVLSPTRELTAQIFDSFVAYGRHLPLRHAVVFGGVGQAPQVQALRRGVDVLVATPGRLRDLMQQGLMNLRAVECFVLDEADRMLDMGFIHEVRRVIQDLPAQRHSILFSATMPPDVATLAHSILRRPVRVEAAAPATTVELVEQRVHFVAKAEKPALLARLLDDSEIERVLVFTRTKHGADRVAKQLRKQHFEAESIHGDKSQTARVRALNGFRDGSVRILVATDIAARGIDVPGITHVVNFDVPNVPENYVHRIGRTARAGRNGVAISLCAEEEHEFLRDIERAIRQRIDVIGDDPRPAATHAPRRPAQPLPAKRPASRPTKQPARPSRSAPAARVQPEAGSATGTRSRRRRSSRGRPRPQSR
ncbi:MAG: DEAD/DEAH box helicase [Planctomycetota bacterium]